MAFHSRLKQYDNYLLEWRPFCNPTSTLWALLLQTYKYVYINNKFLFGCNDFAQLQNPNPRLPLMRQFIMLSAKQLGGILQIHTYILGFVHFSINAPIYIYILGVRRVDRPESPWQNQLEMAWQTEFIAMECWKLNHHLPTRSTIQSPPERGLSRWGGWGLRTIDTLSTSSFNIYAHLAGHFFHAESL